MFLIILGHFAYATNWHFSNGSNLLLVSTIHSLWIGGKLGVNLFVLITGYFLISSTMRRQAFFKIWLESYLYAFLVLLFAISMNLESVNLKNIVKTIFLSSSGYLNWFVSAYLLLYLLAPFINKILLGLSKKQFRVLLLIVFIYFSVFRTIFHNPSIGTTGNDVVWLIVVYLFGAYIRRFKNDILNYSSKKISIILSISLLVSIFSVFLLTLIKYNYNLPLAKDSYALLIDGCSPLQLISAVCIFMLFVKARPSYNGVVNKISGTTFAVYLIHANLLINSWIYNDFVKGNKFGDTPYVILYGIVTSVMIFFVCSMIDLIIKLVFGKLNEKVINFLANLRVWRKFSGDN